MEIVYQGPSRRHPSGFKMHPGLHYQVHDIIHLDELGVVFQLRGFTVGETDRYYTFSPHTFRALNGKRVDLVKAKPNRPAHQLYGDRLLSVIGLHVENDGEFLWCCEHDDPKRAVLSLSYDQVVHA